MAEIKEIHGVVCRTASGNKRLLHVFDWNDHVTIDACADGRELTPEEARYTARMMLRLANRIDARTKEKTP
jgi:hypothetical protein